MKLQSILKVFIVSLLLTITSIQGYSQSATVTINQDSKITQLLEVKKNLERENKLSDGFTVQLYYGELSKANEVLRKYKAAQASWPGTIEYETPNYKVWVGNYASRIEAERALVEIHKTFPTAFILKPERKK